jgi:hypothetical protein
VGDVERANTAVNREASALRAVVLSRVPMRRRASATLFSNKSDSRD